MAQWLVLIVVAILAFAPGIASLPPTDRDESRFVQATKQMAESGDYIDIRFQEEHRYKKPIGIYWLQSAAVALSGDGPDAPIWVYRTVSVAAGVASVLVVAWLGAAIFGANAGVIAGLMLSGMLMLGVEARIAKTDATLLAFAVIAQAALSWLYLAGKGQLRRSRIAPWALWLAMGAGILVKGPVLPLLTALTVVAIVLFDRDRAWLRQLRILPGLLIVLLVAAPWLVAITMRNGLAFWQESVGEDLIGKVASGQESHGFPPGYFALLFPFALWPFGTVALDAGLRLLNGFRADPRLLLLAAWYVPFWLVFEIIPTKLPHYVLPAYPALALAAGWALTRASSADDSLKSGWRLWLRRANLFGLVLVTIGLASASIAAAPIVLGEFSIAGVVAAILFVAAGWLGWSTASRPTPLRTVGLATMTAAAAVAVATIAIAPALRPIWLSPQLASIYKSALECPSPLLVSAGYHEPSLVFLSGTSTVLTDGPGAAAALAERPLCTVAAVYDSELDRFAAAFPGGLDRLEEVGRAAGVNYSKGSEHTIRVFRVRD